MVSSSQVGEAIRARCDDTDEIDESAAVTRIRVISGSLVTMASRPTTLAIFPPSQDRAGRGRFAGATGWLRRTGLRPI